MARPPVPLGHPCVYRYGRDGSGTLVLAWLLHWSPTFAQVRVVGTNRAVGLTAAQTRGLRPPPEGHGRRLPVLDVSPAATVKEAA